MTNDDQSQNGLKSSGGDSSDKSSSEFRTIHDAGISALMSIYKNHAGKERSDILYGIGDDAAVMKAGSGETILSNSELLLEGVHFDLTYTPLHHLGFKLLTAGVSDIIAMNGRPVMASVSVAVPNKISVQMLETLYKGIDTAANYYGLQVTGGDTAASHQALVLSVHVTGTAPKESLVTRQGASEGDALCVTGDLGAAMAGLRILMREKESWKESGSDRFQPDLESWEYVVQRQLTPASRSTFTTSLEESGVMPTSMIDVTKGLMNDVQLLCDASGTGCELFAPAVPIALETRRVADEMKEDVDRYAFYGGEDFELLFTLDDADVEKLKAEFEDFAVIGKMTSAASGVVIQTGEES